MTKLEVKKQWSKEDVTDFFSDFFNINLSDKNSVFEVSRDFEDYLIDQGYTHTQQVIDMGEGVEKFLERIINLIPNDLR